MVPRTRVLVLGLLTVAIHAANARTIFVSPPDSIQAAVDQAAPGDTVAVEPGTYHEPGRPCPNDPSQVCAVAVTTDNVALVGLSSGAVILENPGGQDEGIAVAKASASGPTCLTDPNQRINGALVQGFTVNGFDDNGIFLFCVDNWRIQDNSVNNNAEYGIFPSHCGSGEVIHNVATGSNDTGIYVGQSHDVRIDHNLAMGNVSGYELENCSSSRVDHNESTGNTGGILTFTNIFLDVKQNVNNRVDHNNVHDNNKPNSCLNPSDEVCAVPRGTGLLVLAADSNQIDHNTVTGNNSFGIAVANFCVANRLTPDQCAALDIEPNPDNDHIVENNVTGNGTNPDPSVAPVFTVDLAWDGTGTGNCWQHNVAGTEFPPVLPTCH